MTLWDSDSLLACYSGTHNSWRVLKPWRITAAPWACSSWNASSLPLVGLSPLLSLFSPRRTPWPSNPLRMSPPHPVLQSHLYGWERLWEQRDGSEGKRDQLLRGVGIGVPSDGWISSWNPRDWSRFCSIATAYYIILNGFLPRLGARQRTQANLGAMVSLLLERPAMPVAWVEVIHGRLWPQARLVTTALLF